MKATAVLLATCASMLTPFAANAQPSAQRDPADPSVPVSAARYESAFEGYQAFQDQKPAPWKEINEEMGRLGGHAGHMDSGANPHAAHQRPTFPQSPEGDSKPDSAPSGHGMDHKK